MKLRITSHEFYAWYLIPTIRLGFHSDKKGGFIALTFLKFDLCLSWSSE